MIRRPVWLLSMDTEQFRAPPLTTGGLKARFLDRGRTARQTEVELVHFLERAEVDRWRAEMWPGPVRSRAQAAVAAGVQPVFGFSCYTWNVAEFIEIAREVKAAMPPALVIAGGPHVQQAESFLYGDGIDVVVIGEGEETLCALLDCSSPDQWRDVAGCAYLTPRGKVHRTAERARSTALDDYRSALDVIELRDGEGRPRYKQAAYETSRGCPYRCSFCEWGTGAIGTKMYQFSLERVRSDFERLVAGGVEDIWLCDSNFGALREDVAKAEMIVELRRRFGLPRTFATSWSKNHNKQVHHIVRILHRQGLLSHYHLSLQTLTPRALQLSHRSNMRANEYEPIARSLAAEGIPVAAELIWGLPGDTLAEFEANLDHLLTVFPNINIFGYTLLPGTEFYERRDEYRLEAIPVAGYGKAKGEYVVGCHTFSRDEGEEGYFLIAAYIVLARGQLMPLAACFLAQEARVAVAPLLRAVLRALLAEFAGEAPGLAGADRISVYEGRAELYRLLIRNLERSHAAIRRAVVSWLEKRDGADLIPSVMRILALDEALCPRVSPQRMRRSFDFGVDRVEQCLARMEHPGAEALEPRGTVELEIDHPGGVGDVILDPDGGAWVRGRIVSVGRRENLSRAPCETAAGAPGA